MPHISQKKLKKEKFLEIQTEFIKIITEFRDKREIKRFFSELLTETEQIMLAKRLAAVLMLERGCRFSFIEKSLKISPSTVARFWRQIKQRRFPLLCEKINKEKNNKRFWDAVENIVRAGMPPMGRGRWKWLYKDK